ELTFATTGFNPSNGNDSTAWVMQNVKVTYNGSGTCFSKSSGQTNDCTVHFTGIRFQATNSAAKFASISGSGFANDSFFCDALLLIGASGAAGPALTIGASMDNVYIGDVMGLNWATVLSGATAFGSDHGLLAGLTDDDHAQYAKLTGRGSPFGNIFSGYASWGTATTGAGWYASVLTYTPGGYWRMGEASGNLADSSGNGNTATQVGAGQTYGVAGGIVGDPNTAIQFPGVNTSYYTIANNASIDVADTFTIIWWIKKAANGTIMTIVGRTTNGFVLRMNASNKLEIVKSFIAVIGTSTTTITDTNWHMVAWTKATTTNKLYIDGVDVTGTMVNQTISAVGTTIAVGRDGQDGSFPWNGSLDEGVIIKGTALSAANIAALYASSQGLPAPTATNDGDVTGTRFFVANDQAFSLQFGGVNPRALFDTGDYLEYVRSTNVLYAYLGSASALELASAALRVRNSGANPGTLYLTGGSSGAEGGQIDMEGAAGQTTWSFDNNSSSLRYFYNAHVYNQFWGPQNGGVAGGTGQDGGVYFEATVAQQATSPATSLAMMVYGTNYAAASSNEH
ncbi:MAG TPA: LamG-like jellyroll fold domain-containing protein, partial [Candidatus Paceibacterota bacterium]